MKYVFISDMHGQFNIMVSNLYKSGFNPQTDTLVVLGDAFDRGPDSLKILKYIMGCPNRILVWGNHDLRLKELLEEKDMVSKHDYSNGLLATIRSFCGNPYLESIYSGLFLLTHNKALKDVYDLLLRYFSECCFAVELDNIIALHAWVPVNFQKSTPTNTLTPVYKENWRESNFYDWYMSTWENTQKMVHHRIFVPHKTLLIGHWHAWRLREFTSNGAIRYEEIKDIDFSTFVYEDKFIAIDGCCGKNYGTINVYCIETESLPKLVFAKQEKLVDKN